MIKNLFKTYTRRCPDGTKHTLYRNINDALPLFITDWEGHIKAKTRFISFEPLLGPVSRINLDKIDWMIIGAKTNPTCLPDKKWVRDLIFQARNSGVRVFLKDNLQWNMKIQKFP